MDQLTGDQLEPKTRLLKKTKLRNKAGRGMKKEKEENDWIRLVLVPCGSDKNYHKLCQRWLKSWWWWWWCWWWWWWWWWCWKWLEMRIRSRSHNHRPTKHVLAPLLLISNTKTTTLLVSSIQRQIQIEVHYTYSSTSITVLHMRKSRCLQQCVGWTGKQWYSGQKLHQIHSTVGYNATEATPGHTPLVKIWISSEYDQEWPIDRCLHKDWKYC